METCMPYKKRPSVIARFPAALFFVTFLASLLACPVFGHTAQQEPSGAARYVSAQGSDARSGLSWVTAKNTIAAAMRSCPASGSCTIHVSSLTLSAPVVLDRPDTAIQCPAGAILSTAVQRAAPVTVSANGIQITGCEFQYSSGVGSTVVLIPHSVNHTTVSHDVFRNYLGLPSYLGIIRLGNRTNRNAETAITDVSIIGNQFLNVDPDVINLQDNVFRVTISNNVIATDISRSNSPTINAQTPDPGSALESITVTNNSISKGTQNDCIQIQKLTDRSVIQNVTVSGNTCRLQPNAGAGTGATGYSMVGIAGLVETGNVFEGYGQLITGNAPFEVANCQRATSSHNVANLGTADANVTAFTVIGTQRALVRDVSLTGNSVSMTVRGSAQGSCYHVYAARQARVEQVTLTGNSCDLSGSTTGGALHGIWIQANGTGAAIQGGALSGNIVTGSTRAAVVGIHFERNAGAISGWRVGQNHFRNTRRNIVGMVPGRP